MTFLTGFILALINVISILGGFLVYGLTKAKTQEPIQIISACAFSIILFVLWEFLLRKVFNKKTLKNKRFHRNLCNKLVILSDNIYPASLCFGGYLTSLPGHICNTDVSDSHQRAGA